MCAYTPIKTWTPGETLTSTDLNAEFVGIGKMNQKLLTCGENITKGLAVKLVNDDGTMKLYKLLGDGKTTVADQFSTSAGNVYCAALTSGRVITSFQQNADSKPYATIGIFDGTSLVNGSEYNVVNATSGLCRVSRLDDTHAVLIYNRNEATNHIYAKIAVDDGASPGVISFGAEADLGNVVSFGYVNVVGLSATLFVVVYSVTSGGDQKFQAVACSVAGDAITVGTPVDVYTATGTTVLEVFVSKVSSTSFICMCYRNYSVYAGSISGTTITIGVGVESELSNPLQLLYLTDGKFVVFSASTYEVGDISGTTVTMDNPTRYFPGGISGDTTYYGDWDFKSAAKMGTDGLVLMGTQNINSTEKLVIYHAHLSNTALFIDDYKYSGITNNDHIIAPLGVDSQYYVFAGGDDYVRIGNINDSYRCIGIANATQTTGNTVLVNCNGLVCDAFSGLEAGSVYFATTAGALTNNDFLEAPDTFYQPVQNRKVGYAVSATEIIMNSYRYL